MNTPLPELPLGTYRVTADVTNPEANRSYRGWPYDPVIKAGTLLVSDDCHMNEQVRRGLRSQEKLQYVLLDQELYQALVPHLEAVVERPSDLICRLGTSKSCRYVLDQLALMGKITLDDVQAAYDRAGEFTS